MLVLSRKANESIVINNDITLTVVEIRGDKVRLGIVSPKDVPVHRQEVFEAIHGKPGAKLEPAAVDPAMQLEIDIAALKKQLEQSTDPSDEQRKLLAAMRIQLAALRGVSWPAV